MASRSDPRPPGTWPKIGRVRQSPYLGFNGWTAKTLKQLQVRLTEAFCSLFEQPAILQFQCHPEARVYDSLFENWSNRAERQACER